MHSSTVLRTLTILATVLSASSFAWGGTPQPNIIHIMIDDAGPGDFTSFWADSPVNTPNIDALAAGGMRFTTAYAGAANCAPSRSALMTGMHLGHAYMRVNAGANSIRDADVTIAEVLRDAGYATAGYGKWGLGAPGTAGAAERQGFDEYVGYYDQVHAHYHFPDRIYDSGAPLLIPENNGFNEPETGLVSNNRVHAHGVIFDRMQQFVRTNSQSGTPFYAWGAWTPPHRRSTLNESTAEPGGYYHQYTGEPGWDDFDRIQAAFVTWIDDQVGQLQETLDDPNGDGDDSDSVTNNTLIIFTSDNGGWQSQHNWDRNIETRNGQTVDLRGAKEGYYEGGLRTPMIAYWPGTIQPGTESDRQTAFYDYLPTFAELAGAQDVPPVNGVSFAPTLTGVGTEDAREGLYFEGYAYNANSTPTRIARIDDWKMIVNRSGSVELYDLANDPSETNNRANDAAVADVRARLMSFILRSNVPLTSQLRLDPPNVGTSNATRDGVVTGAIRPDGETRDWLVNSGGDAAAFNEAVTGRNAPVSLYLDDLQVDYEVELAVERLADESPIVDVELVGASGFTYFTAHIDTSLLDMGVEQTLNLQMDAANNSPTQGQVNQDMGSGWTLRMSHNAGAGVVQVSEILVTGQDPIIEAILQVGDLTGDGQVDVVDWQVLRPNLFTTVWQLPADERRAAGDLDGDGRINENDFELFKTIYEGLHGPGSLATAASVPEPSTGVLLVGGTVLSALLGQRCLGSGSTGPARSASE